MTRLAQLITLVSVACLLGGCFLTKAATVPMRMGGAVISAVPVVGNMVDGVIDLAADAVDQVPL